MREADRVDRLRLARADGVGPIGYRMLLQRFGTAAAALAALPDLARRGGRAGPARIPTRHDADREIAAVARLGAQLVEVEDDAYPQALAAIDDPPPFLILRGRAELMARPVVGIVGTRTASLNGRRFAEGIAKALGEAGFVVASGLALGIDGAAHRGALATGTIAAVAGGIDRIYPPEHAELHARIGTDGLLVAESAPGTQPHSRFFPRRNRIISGLSLGVVVVEAAMRSGTLITARLASEQGRVVMAVPGPPADPRVEGCHHLIRQGATLVVNAAQIAEAILPMVERPAPLRILPRPAEVAPSPALPAEREADDARAVVLRRLSHSPTAVDELLRDCQLSGPLLHAVLLELELAGRIDRLPGNRVALSGVSPGASPE